MTNWQGRTKETATQHIFRAIREALLSILIAFVVGVIVGILVAEIVGAVLTQATPDWSTNIIALVVGLIVGYAAAATATIWALVVGLAETIKALAGDIEQAGERVVHELETLAGVPDQLGDSTRRAGTVEGSVVSSAEAVMMAPMSGVTSMGQTPTSAPRRSAATLTPSATPSGGNGRGADSLMAPLVPTPENR